MHRACNRFDCICTDSTSMCSTVVIAKIDQKQGPGQGQNKSGAPLGQINVPEGGTHGHSTLRGHLVGSPLGVYFLYVSITFSIVVFDTSLKRSRTQFHVRNGALSGQKGHQNGTEKDPKQSAANV